MQSYIRYFILMLKIYIIIFVSTANSRKPNKSYNQTSAGYENLRSKDMSTQTEYKANNKNDTNDHSEKNIGSQWSRSCTREQEENTKNHRFQSLFDILIKMNYTQESYIENFKSIMNKLKDKKLIRMLCIIYIILAVPLWCSRGWCCCFLFCKIFKPDKTIEEAKKFVELNPPGVLLHRDTVIHYEPSDNERHCYQKFEHLIRTI